MRALPQKIRQKIKFYSFGEGVDIVLAECSDIRLIIYAP